MWGQRAVCIVDERSTKGRARLLWVEPSKPRPNIKSSPLGDMIRHTCNSLLSGLVAITAGCATVEPYGAVAIGCLAAPTYAAASCLMRRLRIDDPLDAFAVHGANGILGIVLVGFFTTEEFSFACDDNGAREAGVFYGGSGRLLAS